MTPGVGQKRWLLVQNGLIVQRWIVGAFKVSLMTRDHECHVGQLCAERTSFLGVGFERKCMSCVTGNTMLCFGSSFTLQIEWGEAVRHSSTSGDLVVPTRICQRRFGHTLVANSNSTAFKASGVESICKAMRGAGLL